MSNQNVVSKPDLWNNSIKLAENKFNNSDLAFEREQIFATQQIMGNSQCLMTARNNPMSVQLAMYNVAAVGLSLNPKLQHAYLISRKINEQYTVTLDISYRGLIALAVKSGAILWAKAELVHENDKFTYRGPTEKPVHEFNPFQSMDQRGKCIGGYCISELSTGAYMVEIMKVEEMNKIRDKSQAYKSGFGPWIEWEDQMRLKSIVKRAYKWWPGGHNESYAEAISILDDDNGEGIIFDSQPTDNQVESINEIPHIQLKFITDSIARATQLNAFKPCENLFNERFKDPVTHKYALEELNKAMLKTAS